MRIQSRVDYRCMSTEICFHTSVCHGSSTKVFRVVYQENLGIFLTTMSQTLVTLIGRNDKVTEVKHQHSFLSYLAVT